MNDRDGVDSVTGPQATTSGLVFIEDSGFTLSDPAGEPSPSPPTPTDEHPVTFGSGAELVCFTSALQDASPHVDIELWAARPPEPAGDWDFSTVARLTVGGSEQSLVSGVSCLPSDHRISIPAGDYVVGVWCRGRGEAQAAFEAWLAEVHEEEEDGEEAEFAGDGVEHWLLRFWPAD